LRRDPRIEPRGELRGDPRGDIRAEIRSGEVDPHMFEGTRTLYGPRGYDPR